MSTYYFLLVLPLLLIHKETVYSSDSTKNCPNLQPSSEELGNPLES